MFRIDFFSLITFLIISASPAAAATVSITFAGQVSDIRSDVGLPVEIVNGAPVTGTFTYDQNTVQNIGGGLFGGPSLFLSLNVAGLKYEMQNGQLGAMDRLPGNVDTWSVNSRSSGVNASTVTGPGLFEPSGISLDFFFLAPDMINGLLPDQPGSPPFNQNALNLGGPQTGGNGGVSTLEAFPGTGFWNIRYSIDPTSVSVTVEAIPPAPIPVPASGLLLISSLSVVVIARRRYFNWAT